MQDSILIRFEGPDGLALAAREWAGPSADAKTVLCLHGLTRNSRDFDGLAGALRTRFRVVAPDQRGRGRSGYDPDPNNYAIPIQVRDTWTLLDKLGIERFIAVGTSMGALMSIAMANEHPERFAGLVLNDAGPEIDPAGLARIAGYVGKGGPVTNWSEAEAALKAIHGLSYPTYTGEDWQRMARATYIEDANGFRPDYDAGLAAAFGTASGASPDLWPLFEICARIPTLLLRGAHSDILARRTADAMVQRFGVTLVEIANRGHAPDLMEPDALSAIEVFAARNS